MTTVGETLRRERLQRKLDLDHVTHELKISRRMLDAIESDHYEQLPGAMFAKAFVRQYAALLGLDGETLAAQVQRSVEPEFLEGPERSRPAVTPIEVPRVEEWNSVGDKRFALSGSLPAAALVVVVMLVCSAVYAWMQRPKTAPSTQVQETARQATAPPPVRTEPVPQPVAPATQTAPTSPPPAETPVSQPSTAPAVASETPTAAPAAPGPVHVEIVADEAVWVLARVDGKFAFSDTLAANTKRTLDGTNEVYVRLGNAGGASISLNGKPIGAAGPKGQVRSLQFTSGGFQIVSAKPAPAVPLDPLDR